MGDICSQAQALADLFQQTSETVRTFLRSHFDELSSEDRDTLQASVFKFQTLHGLYIAEEIGQELEKIGPQLKQLEDLTQQAHNTLKTLKKIQLAGTIVRSLVEAATEAASGNYECVVKDLACLGEALTAENKPAVTAAG